MASPTFFTRGHTPTLTDSRWFILQRILGAVIDGGGGGGGGGSGTGQSGIVGVVDPEGVVTATPGTTYLNTALETFWVKHSGNGNTGWIPNLV
jgi:hypothetical protein